MDSKWVSCAISTLKAATCDSGTCDFASFAAGSGAVAEEALQGLGSFGDDRSDPVGIGPGLYAGRRTNVGSALTPASAPGPSQNTHMQSGRGG